jgi:hypothetical protein
MEGSSAEMVARSAEAVGGLAVGRLAETGGLEGAVWKSVVVGSSVARSLAEAVGGLAEAGSLLEAVGKLAVGSSVVGSLAERSAEAVRKSVVGISAVVSNTWNHIPMRGDVQCHTFKRCV